MDTLKREMGQLEIENRRLREGNPDQEKLLELEAELKQSKEEIAHLTEQLGQLPCLEQQLSEALAQGEELRQELQARCRETDEQEGEKQLRESLTQAESDAAESRSRLKEIEAQATHLAAELEHREEELLRVQKDTELQIYRAVDAERQKWEKREERLIEQISLLQAQLRSSGTEKLRDEELAERRSQSSDDRRGEETSSPGKESPVQQTRKTRVTFAEGPSEHTDAERETEKSTQEVRATDLSQALLAQQLPPLPKYTGEEQSQGETFRDWLEQFELVASLGEWDEKTKLVNLVTRLRGQAYAFYRSCTLQQRACYATLVTELTKRFTPVQIQAVQSSLFHDRKQKPRETVDAYAQDLRQRFYKAYPTVQQGTREAEEMGQLVLANQFVAGLLPELKTKVAGSEGKLEQLLTKARFEEAKLRELTVGRMDVPSTSHPKGAREAWQRSHGPPPPKDNHHPNRSNFRGPPVSNPPRSYGESPRCFNCNAIGHISRNCPRQRRQEEARGRNLQPYPPRSEARMAAVVPGTQASTMEIPQTMVSQRSDTQENSVLDSALNTITATMHGLTSANQKPGLKLGPTLTTEVEIEGVPVQALLDTGSPATIVSLNLLLEVLASQRPKSQSPTDWRAEVEKRLEPSMVALQNYGGDQLPLIRQIQVNLSKAGKQANAIIQVQHDAPVGLLLGTDVLPQLGFAMLESDPNGMITDLLLGQKWPNQSIQPKSGTPTEQVQREVLPQEPSLSLAVSEQEPSDSTAPTANNQAIVPNAMPARQEEPVYQHAIVRLLQAVRLPARHKKLLKAKVEGSTDGPCALFEPEPELGAELSMPEALVKPDASCIVTLVMENSSFEPTRLKKGRILGQLYPASILSDQDPQLDTTEPTKGDGVNLRMACTHSCPTTDIENLPASSRVQSLLELLHLESSVLSIQELKCLQDFLIQHEDVFALDSSELGSTDIVTHSIDTGDQPPIRQPVRRTPFALRSKVDEMVKEMMEQGVVQPSHSPWASPIVLVKKKDGGTRFCVDFRRLNAITKQDVFPLPRIDDTLDLLSSAKYFTTLDLASGYWQVKMAPESQEKTAFATYSGLYEFTVMPFGLCNAPATFQRLMETVLAGLARKTCMVYIDDILVFSKTFEEHLTHLEQIFNRLRQAGLRLKLKKCTFAQPKVEYLGHVVTRDGIEVDPKKVEAVKGFPQPTNLKTLRSFLGLASYYRRFIPNFSKEARPLHSLTGKNAPFVWTPTCQQAFDKLKQLLTNAPVLAFPNFELDFILETDASGDGLGAVLAQKHQDGGIRPVAFASRTLQPHEKNYGATELEALGVVWAAKHFRPYLYGHHCDLYTDHEALKSLLNTPQPSGKLARWGMAIQELDLSIHYRPGKKNSNADALSRYPNSLEVPSSHADQPLAVVAATNPSWSEAKGGEPTLPKLQREDPQLMEIIRYLQDGILPDNDKEARELALTKSQYELVDGVLYHVENDKTLRIVPPTTHRKKLFDEVHSGILSGHLREAKMHGQLSRHYWWPQMRADIRRWCKACITCASRRIGRTERPPMTPIPVSGPFDRVGVDVVQFPTSYNGNKYAVVFVDYLTKWPEVFAVPDQTADTIAHLLVEQIVCRHGVPTELLSDRGSAFLSVLLQEVYQLLGTHKVSTTAYHPQTDGLVEWFNRTLIDMLAKTVEKNGRDWDRHLPHVLFAYRASPQESTKESPFFLLYGRDPQLPTEAALNHQKTRYQVDLDDYKLELTDSLTQAWKLAQSQIKKAQKHQKLYYDRHAKTPKFCVGDRVFVYMPSAKKGKAHKFARPFHGPFRVIELTANDAKVCPVNRPKADPIFVSLDRVRYCPEEISPEESWPHRSVQRKTRENDLSVLTSTDMLDESDATATPIAEQENKSPWDGRLRSRQQDRARTPDT